MRKVDTDNVNRGWYQLVSNHFTIYCNRDWEHNVPYVAYLLHRILLIINKV